MYFILYKDNDDKWLPIKFEGTIRIVEDLEEVKNFTNHPREYKVFNLNHTIDEQLIVSDKLAKLNNILDNAIHNGQP